MHNPLAEIVDLPLDWKEMQDQFDPTRSPDKYGDFYLNVLEPPYHLSPYSSWETTLVNNPKLLNMFLNHNADVLPDCRGMTPQELRQEIKGAIRYAKR